MYAAEGKAVVCKKVEVSYTDGREGEERLKRISDILSGGVYAYLKQHGLLKEDSGRATRVKKLLKEAKEVGFRTEGVICGEDSRKMS